MESNNSLGGTNVSSAVSAIASRSRTPSKPTTCVNGIGMFDSWKRNFKSPFYAMLDIIDNAIDAGFDEDQLVSFDGRVDIHENFIPNPLALAPDHVLSSNGMGANAIRREKKKMEEKRSELIIVNNSIGAICPLDEILEIHRSAKGSLSESIGENGVGLKQGCASLSDLSFVLTHNKGDLSFGVIARSLQHEEGCYLPSFKLDSSKDVKINLTELLSRKDLAGVAECVTEYGFGSLEEGIKMLTDHAIDLTTLTKWGLHDHVFKLIITDIQSSKKENNAKNGGAKEFKDLLEKESSDSENEVDDEEDGGGFLDSVVSSAITTSARGRRSSMRRGFSDVSILDESSSDTESNPNPFESVINQLVKELPRYYIHIPNNFNISINKKRISFNYWQRHLVGMMRFDQKICQERSFASLQNLQEPGGSHMKVRIFCGFDPIRAEDSSRQSTLSVYIYSRKSGRLIKEEGDGRNMLNITSGGTGYCQGLTCIVDDMDGQIPLNPTKQDVAFSEKRNGEILGENLYAWTSAIISMYYRFQLNKYIKSRKTDLSVELARYAGKVAEKFSNLPTESNGTIKSLAKSDFSTLNHVVWRKQNCKIQGKDKILATISAKIQEIPGKDSLFHLYGNKNSPKPKTANKAKRKRTSAAIPEEVLSAAKRAKVEDVPLGRRRTRQPRNIGTACVASVSTESGDENDDDEDFEIGGFEPVVTKRVIPRRTIKPVITAQSEQKQDQDLAEQLEKVNKEFYKQKHDYQKLHEEQERLQGENQRMFEEIEFFHSQKESTNTINNSEEYDMLLEVKSNLETENERLQEEVVYLSSTYTDEKKKMQAEIEYLTEKQKSMDKKLQAERILRIAAEEEAEALEKNMLSQKG